MKYDYAGVGPHVREDVQKSDGYEVRTDYTHTYVQSPWFCKLPSGYQLPGGGSVSNLVEGLSATWWRVCQLPGGGSVSYQVEGLSATWWRVLGCWLAVSCSCLLLAHRVGGFFKAGHVSLNAMNIAVV